MQYGIRLAKEDIAFGEFCRLLKGLTADTPLGRIVAVRAEKDPERVRNFGRYERDVRKVWRDFRRGCDVVCSANWHEDVARLQGALARAFG